MKRTVRYPLWNEQTDFFQIFVESFRTELQSK